MIITTCTCSLCKQRWDNQDENKPRLFQVSFMVKERQPNNFIQIKGALGQPQDLAQRDVCEECYNKTFNPRIPEAVINKPETVEDKLTELAELLGLLFDK